MNDNTQAIVALNDGEEVIQPEMFRCCPLGIQFYSNAPVEQFNEIKIRLKLTSRSWNGEVNCSGMVVHCDRTDNSGLHRVWVYFVEIKEKNREDLRCFANEAQCLCPFCQNF